MNVRKLKTLTPVILSMALAASLQAQTPSDPADFVHRDGSHDFDFLIGDWKAHVRCLPERLAGSNDLDKGELDAPPVVGGESWEVNWICELAR